MNNFFSRLSYSMMNFMRGRNGMDTCAQWALIAGLVLTVIDFLVGSALLSTLGLICIIYSMFRCYSRNIAARALENARFEHATQKPRQRWEQLNRQWVNRKTTKYFKCKQCGQSLSVPKGKGTLRITCPKCHTQSEIKS